MKCYKVVQVRNGRLWSIGNIQQEYILEYITDKIIYPVLGTKLYVFDSLIHAKYYADGSGWGYQVWECEGADLTKCTGYSTLCDGLDTFWELFKKNIHYHNSPAKGAMFVSQLKLLKRV